jgi:hypothetical protein
VVVVSSFGKKVCGSVVVWLWSVVLWSVAAVWLWSVVLVSRCVVQ